jgi:hypothetical protein
MAAHASLRHAKPDIPHARRRRSAHGAPRRLETIAADRKAPHKHVWRARIVWLSADGVGTNAIMAATGTAKTTVWRWQERFVAEGADGLLRDKTRPAGKAPVPDQHPARVVEKLYAVAGLYVAPPAHAVVLSVDEKSQILALDRTQPALPLKKGRGATLTHDCKRHGTTTLFAALNVLAGEVFGRNVSVHRRGVLSRLSCGVAGLAIEDVGSWWSLRTSTTDRRGPQ